MPTPVTLTDGLLTVGNEDCLVCPVGKGFSPDFGPNVLRAMVEEIYFNGLEAFDYTETNLPRLPMRPASTRKMNGVTGFSYDVHMPNVANDTVWYNPFPANAVFNRDGRTVQNCGITDPATISLFANQNTIACAPPDGFGAVAGRRTQYREPATATFRVGPLCIGDFQDQMMASQVISAYFDAVKKGAGVALSYQMMRMFIGHSHNVVAMRAEGKQFAPNKGAGQFVTMPNSSGTFETLMEAINQAELPFSGTFRIRMSGQLWEHLVRDYHNRNAINLVGSVGALSDDVRKLFNLVEGPNTTWTLHDKRYPRRRFIFEVGLGTYAYFRRIGPALADWAFQEQYTQYVSPDAGTGAGILTRPNQDWGKQCSCPNEDKILSELLFIVQDGSDTLVWEAFPRNNPGTLNIPGLDLAAYRSRFRGGSAVETDAEMLWNSSTFKIYTGGDVDLYFLNKINSDNAANENPTCYNNQDNTWFAAKLTVGGVMTEKKPQASTVIAVAVPVQDTAISLTCCPIGEPPAATTIIGTPKAPEPPALCQPIEAADPIVLPAGTLWPPGFISVQALCAGTKDSGIRVTRMGGSEGALVLTYTIVNDTAIRGTDFTTAAASGNLDFADGVKTMELDMDIIAWQCSAGEIDAETTTKQFTITWAGAGLDAGAWATTTVTIQCCTAPDNTCPPTDCPTC